MGTSQHTVYKSQGIIYPATHGEVFASPPKKKNLWHFPPTPSPLEGCREFLPPW